MPALEPVAKWAGRVLDALILLVFLSMLANTLNSWVLYWYGADLLERHFEVLFYLLVGRSLWLVPWGQVRQLRPLQWPLVLAAAGVYTLFLHTLLMVNLYAAALAVVETRAAFHGASDREIAIDITEWNKWYPRMSFVYDVLEQTPEDAGIAYVGDQRAHIMSYLLYPRRVYALPEMQEILNFSIQENWTWSHIEDPFFPQKDPLNPVPEPGFSKDAPNREMQAAMIDMIERNDIGWVLYYDSLYPENSFLHKLPEGFVESARAGLD